MNSQNATKPDPLDVAAASVVTPIVLRLMHGYEPDLFFDGDRFMRHLDRTYDHFDVATYSMSKAFTTPLRRIHRLIYGLRQHGTTTGAKEKRYVMNSHAKLFLCYGSKGTVDAFVGNQNLTHGTNLNITMKARPEHVEPLVAFFNTLWENAV